MSEKLQNMPLSEQSDNPYLSLEKLYKEFYYDKQLRDILEGKKNKTSDDTSPKGIKKRLKKKIRFRIMYNGLIMVALLYIVLSLSMSWFDSNKHPESQGISLHVYDSSIPVYLNANYNTANFLEYRDDEISLRKTIIPGDVIKLSVFFDLAGMPNVKTIELEVQNMQEFLDYIPDTAILHYADKKINDETDFQLHLDKILTETIIPSPVFDEDKMVFKFDIPEDYDSYDGLCLDFQIYFIDDFENQNTHMAQTIKLRFAAKDVTIN